MTPTPDIRVWSHEPLSAEVKESPRRVATLEDVEVTAAMPDVHLADGVCVGAVVATSRRLLPNAVGGEIGCGMCALAFDGVAASARTPSSTGWRASSSTTDSATGYETRRLRRTRISVQRFVPRRNSHAL